MSQLRTTIADAAQAAGLPQPLILNKVSELKALCEKDEKPAVPVYLQLAHFLKTRRQQVALLKTLQQQYPTIQYYRTSSRKMYSIKFNNADDIQ